MGCGPGAEEQPTLRSLKEAVRTTGTPLFLPGRAHCPRFIRGSGCGSQIRPGEAFLGFAVAPATEHCLLPASQASPRPPTPGAPVLTRRGALLKLVIEVQREHQHVGQDVVHGCVGLQEGVGRGAGGGPRLGGHTPAPGSSASHRLGEPELHRSGLPFAGPERRGSQFLTWQS